MCLRGREFLRERGRPVKLLMGLAELRGGMPHSRCSFHSTLYLGKGVWGSGGLGRLTVGLRMLT
jgi:hypothetical protein